MYCINCGVELADSETVCPLCGTRGFTRICPGSRGSLPSAGPVGPPRGR